MSSITELWIDNFENATVDLVADVGNGYVSEPAGSSLLVGCNSGQDCNGWDGLLAPYARQNLDAAISAGGGDQSSNLIIIEARITGFTYSTTECIEYLTLDYDRLYGFWLGWYPSNSNLYVQGRQGGTGITHWSGGTYSAPSTTPHRYRMILNFTDRPRRLPDLASQYSLNPGEVAFVASVDDGVSWSWVHTRDLSEINNPVSSDLNIGLMCRNWGALPSMEQESDYLRVLQTEGEPVRDIPDEPREPQDELGFTDLEAPDQSRPLPPPRKAGAYTDGIGGQDDWQWSTLEDEHQGGGSFFPDVSRQLRTAHGSGDRQEDEIGFRDADNAGNAEQGGDYDDGGKALIVGFGAAGTPRYFYPAFAPTEDKRYGGPGDKTPWKKGHAPYPTDGRVLGGSLQINTRFYGINYGYDYPAKDNEPHSSQAGVFDGDERWLSDPADYSIDTIDQYGRPHFGYGDARVVNSFLYDTTGELWTTPTNPSFTGYGRDGKYYVGGVDQGSQAPWALESPSDVRGGRSDFPERALIVVGRNEVVIFDLIQYPTYLNLWMRFKIGADSSNFWMLGRGSSTLRAACMKDGVLCVATEQTPWEVGRLHLVSFKATNENCGHLIGSDDHWRWQTGYDITHRHEPSHWEAAVASPELRIFSEYNRDCDVHQIGDTLYFAVAGEDAEDPVVVQVDSPSGVPQLVTQAYGEDIGSADDEEECPRCVMFDSQGMLWHSNDYLLWRNGFDYQAGVLFCSTNFGSQKFVRLPSRIRFLADDGKLLWAGTDKGVYRIEKGTLSWRFAYGLAGSGAGGRLGVPGSGELIPGEISRVSGMQIARLAESSFLSVSTGPLQAGGGAVLIRLYDDAVLDSKLWPDLKENGAYSHGVVYG